MKFPIVCSAQTVTPATTILNILFTNMPIRAWVTEHGRKGNFLIISNSNTLQIWSVKVPILILSRHRIKPCKYEIPVKDLYFSPLSLSLLFVVNEKNCLDKIAVAFIIGWAQHNCYFTLSQNSVSLQNEWKNGNDVIITSLLNRFVWNTNTRSIQRMQTPPRLWPLTMGCDLDLKSRSKRLMSLDVAYCIVSVQDIMPVNGIVCEIWPLVHFFWLLTFAYDLHRPSRSLSFSSINGRYVVVYWFQVRSL